MHGAKSSVSGVRRPEPQSRILKKKEKAAMAAMAASRPDIVVADTKQEKTVVMELTNPG